MIDARRWDWKLDMTEMLCFNEENEVVVKIIRDGKRIKGRMLDMSMELFGKLAVLRTGPKIVQQIIFAAEDEYWKAHFRNGRIDRSA